MSTEKRLRFYLRPAITDADKHQRGILLANMRHHRTEIEQLFRDYDHWNRTHPDEEPVNVDPDGVLRQLAADYDAALLAEQEKPQ